MEARHLVLVGMPGVGKTTIGKELALAAGLAFYDTDHELEKSWVKKNLSPSVADFIRENGEDAFRLEEKYIIEALLQKPYPSVIATGGGLPCFNGLMSFINVHALSIYLKQNVQVLVSRFSQKDIAQRPLLAKALEGKNKEEQVHLLASHFYELLEKRAHFYTQACLTIELANGATAKRVVEMILQLV